MLRILFQIFHCFWGKENHLLYQGIIEIHYIEVPLHIYWQFSKYMTVQYTCTCMYKG